MKSESVESEKTVADFFAGIGLASEGLKREGWSVEYALDHDSDKHEMYEHNYGKAPYYEVEDIARVSASGVPTVDLAHASFPCTDTSLAGSRDGIHGDGESSTYWEFARILREMGDRRPPLVTLENVDALLTSGEGEDLEAALRSLNELGYSVDVLIIDASHFVPHSRVRLFVVAQQREGQDGIELEQRLTRSGKARPEKIRDFIRDNPDLKWRLRDLPRLPQTDLEVRDIVDQSEDDWWEEDRAEYLFSQMYDRDKEKVREMMEKDDWQYGTVFRRTRKRNGKRQSTAELRTDGIAGCLRTPKGGSARQILVRAGKGQRDARLLNARECARLMGAPDFKLEEDASLTQHLWGFGDAVCAPVMEWLAENYLSPILNESEKRLPMAS
jgi:DNA (cytosine-5)-methyltransferase 1